jgi:hypothetical protein
MSKRERIARLTADLLERQAQYKDRISMLSQTKRKILSEVRGSEIRISEPLPEAGRISVERSRGSSIVGGSGWNVRTPGQQVTVTVTGSSF